MVAIRVDAGDDDVAHRAAESLGRVAAATEHVVSGRVRLMGPAKAPIERLRGRYRYRLMLRSAERHALRSVALTLASRMDDGLSPARASLDVDPVSML